MYFVGAMYSKKDCWSPQNENAAIEAIIRNIKPAIDTTLSALTEFPIIVEYYNTRKHSNQLKNIRMILTSRASTL